MHFPSFAPAKNFAPAKKEEEKEVETDPAAATAHDDDDDLSLRGLRLIRARERESEREKQENFVKRIKRQPLVSSNGFKRTKYAAERSLFFSELQSIQRLDMSAIYVLLLLLLMLFLMLMLLSFVPRARRLRSCLTSLSLSLFYIMERQQIKLSDNSVRSSLPAEPVLLSPRCLLVVLASSVPFFVLVPLPVRNLRVVNSHLPRPPSVCLPRVVLCVYRTGSSTRANRTGRKKRPNRGRRGMRLGRSIAPLVLGQG